MAKNYYIILGLTNCASEEDIRSAYRRLAKEYHPDHYGDDSGPFLQIQEAYGVLSDPSRKHAYDSSLKKRTRQTEIVRDVTAETLSGKHVEPLDPFSNRTPGVHVTRSFNTFTPSFDEIFDHLWSNFSNLDRPKSETRRPLTIDIPLSSGQARKGGQVRILVPAEATCPTCRGRGGTGLWECWRCAGEGRISGDFPVVVGYPSGIEDGHTTMISLDKLGIHNTYLTVRFRVTAEAQF